MLCELLEQQADIYELKGETSGARNLYLKSLNIIMNVIIFDSDNQGDSDDPVLKPNQDKVDELVKKMGLPGVPTESKLLLFQYYELTKKYAKAEDVLYNLMDTAGKNSDILARGMDFYERLSGKDPAELEAGNLPMDEVLEGLAKLRLLNEETRLN